MKYYKVISLFKKHHGLKYKKGLNTDVMPFSPHGSCRPGGIYFSREDILAFLGYGTYICEVTLPEGEEVYKEPLDTFGGWLQKFKAHRVILGPFRFITIKVIKELIAEGANLNAGDDFTILRRVLRKGDAALFKLYLENGICLPYYYLIRMCDEMNPWTLRRMVRAMISSGWLKEKPKQVLEVLSILGAGSHYGCIKDILKSGVVCDQSIPWKNWKKNERLMKLVLRHWKEAPCPD